VEITWVGLWRGTHLVIVGVNPPDGVNAIKGGDNIDKIAQPCLARGHNNRGGEGVGEEKVHYASELWSFGE